MADKEEAKPEKREIKQAHIVEVTTQTAPAVQLEDGTVVSDLELGVLIYNKLCKIERSIT